MARTVIEIQQEIINNVQADAVLSEKLTSTSKTAIWRLWTYIVAVSTWALEKLFDAHKAEVNTILATKQTHNLRWYSEKAKAFQYGHALSGDGDTYDVVDEESQIIGQASASESNGILTIKVAKSNNGVLSALTTDELAAFTQYIAKIKDAGVRIVITSSQGDDLRLVLSIIYDPLVLDSEGKLLTDSSREPVRETIERFIQSLSFNGEFAPVFLVDALQQTDGVDIPEVLSCETKYALNDWLGVNGFVIPNAGYLTVTSENLTINYRPNVRN